MNIPEDMDILPAYDDYIFKSLMSRPEAKLALMDLISAAIGRKVTSVEIRGNELPVTDVEEKNERLDLNCVIDGSDQVDVEMQASSRQEIGANHTNFINKMVYYLTDLHSSQSSKGLKYSELVRTYQIVFSMHTVFPKYQDYMSLINMRRLDGELITDQINMVIIELSKLGSVLKKPAAEITPLEMWSVCFLSSKNPQKKRQNSLFSSRENPNYQRTYS